MSFEIWLAYTVAAAILCATPGPTILLVTGFALRHGSRRALPAVLGVVAGDAIAMALSLAGVGAIVAASADLFTLLKLMGAGYLIWLGLEAWRTPVPRGCIDVAQTTAAQMQRRAFVVTALNPKGIMFFIVFLPQFVSASAPVMPQLLLLGVTFLMIAGLSVTLYVLLAGRLQERLRDGRGLRWANRLGGSCLIGAGVLTATLRRAG